MNISLVDQTLTLEEKQSLATELSYENFNGTKHRVAFANDVQKIEHGLPFIPNLDDLSVDVSWRRGDVSVYLDDRDPDSKYVYVKGAGRGEASIRILHPTQRGKT